MVLNGGYLGYVRGELGGLGRGRNNSNRVWGFGVQGLGFQGLGV